MREYNLQSERRVIRKRSVCLSNFILNFASTMYDNDTGIVTWDERIQEIPSATRLQFPYIFL